MCTNLKNRKNTTDFDIISYSVAKYMGLQEVFPTVHGMQIIIHFRWKCTVLSLKPV